MTNVVLITADDMDALSPSSFGGPAGITPRLDELGAAPRRIRGEGQRSIHAAFLPSDLRRGRHQERPHAVGR
ncbi:hypothetical protein ACO03V_15670 [Microbacterium sp. HMH0099]|uniref:hypothetical protein n=1 Tax=Microbacterium sp. HMH0099 TaxID=3414026 RepID=UPI003BF6BE42